MRNINEKAKASGIYTVKCFDKNGKLKWADTIKNLVTTQGKNFLLDNGLAGSGYTAAWYIGLISSVSYVAVAVGDTAAQINGTNQWKEAGGANAPTYTGPRKTTVWSAAAAGAKTLSAALTFAMTGAGTAKGCFLASTSTIDGTTGTLYSAGLFSNGDKVVGNGDSLQVTYSASL